MDATIRLGDLGLLLLGAALIVLIVYAIMVLKNLNDTLKIFRKLVNDNRENIDLVLDQAPSIAENIESISGDLAHDVKAFQGTIDQIAGTSEVAAGALSEHTDIMTSILGVVKFIIVIKEFFEGLGKKKRRVL
jgi:uncharacterized protein YoxC